MANALQLIGGSVPRGLESHTKERKEIRIIDIVRKESSMKTGKLIEALMHYRHVSLEEMSNATNIAQSNITTLLTCRRSITPSLAKKICKVLDIDPIVIMTNRMVDDLKEK